MFSKVLLLYIFNKMNNNLTSAQNHDAKYDLIKFILSLSVLAIHSAIYPMILYPWLRIAVPLFFMLSSYFIFSKLFVSPCTNHKVILNNFISRNLQLYLSWSLILLPITIYVRKEKFFSNDFLGNVITILKSTFFGSTFVASWFIPAIIIGVLTVYSLSKVLKNDYMVFLLCFFAFCVVTFASSYTSVIGNTFLVYIINGFDSLFGNSLVLSFPASLLWVFIGKIFAEQKIQIKPLWLLIFLILLSCMGLYTEWKVVMSLDGSYNNDSYFMLAPLCALAFIGIQKIKPFYWKNSIHLKRASTIIYVAHASILRIISKLASILFNARNSLLLFILTLLCCISIYIMIVLLLKYSYSQRMKKFLKMLY